MSYVQTLYCCIYMNVWMVFLSRISEIMVFLTGNLMTSEGSSVKTAADFEVLTKGDIAGALLDGKKRKQLNITQLKRWLACRGAPLSGKKPQLIKRLDYL